MSRFPLAAAALLVVVGFAGCGTNGKSTTNGKTVSPVTDPAVRAAAARKVERAASPLVNRTRDRNLRGPKKLRAKCRAAGDSAVACEVTAYARPQAIYSSPNAPYSVAIASEDWTVPVTAGRVGKPRRKGGAAIADFLEADDTFNCSGGESLNC